MGRKKGLFNAFVGVGCVLDGVYGFPWLLGAFLGERGRVAPTPIFSGSCRWRCYPLPNREKIFLGNPREGQWVCFGSYILYTPQRLRKNFNTKPKAVLQGRGFIYYTPLFREQNFFMKAKGRSDAVRIGILYIKRTWGKGCICPVALTWLPKNGKMAAKWLRQNRQCKSCGSIANLAMR